jgi:flavin reductase (DIM6/NTAB) family NADH-FMN oxidoreductase RutF
MSSETHAHFDFAATSKPDIYKLLASTVLPRPIAWITSLDVEGSVNAAPFSFFNVVCSDPPLFAVGFSGASDRNGKDTLANIRATGELVVNMVSEELADAMNITAIDAPRGVDELALTGLATVPSAHVKAPRIAASPVSYECTLFQIIDTGTASSVLLARVLGAHVRHDAFANEARLYINPANMRLVGRMHGAGGYCTTRDEFEIPRISWAVAGAKLQGNK